MNVIHAIKEKSLETCLKEGNAKQTTIILYECVYEKHCPKKLMFGVNSYCKESLKNKK